MAKQRVKDNIWKDRISGANRYYESWETLFKCKILEEYYEGLQWKSQKQITYNPYVINKYYETIQIKIAEFVPTFPRFHVNPIPSAEEFDLESAASAANIKQDVLNELIQNPLANFSQEMEMAYKDSFFRFAVMEVGYAADWIINPNAPKPLLAKDVDKNVSGKNKSAIKFEPPELPVNERIYFKHIGAKRFRVGGIDHKYLSRCGWVGYYEWVHRDDLLSMKIMNRDKVETAQSSIPQPDTETRDAEGHKWSGDQLKVWHIWDIRSLNRLIILDSPTVTIYQKPYKRLNLFDYRPDRRLITEGFYPIPPSYHWLSPQNEINETREMLRTHRRRFIRKFQALSGAIDDEEKEKFETGPDGAVITVNRENAITPILNADLGSALGEAIQTSSLDFNEISGTSNQDRQVSDRGTATEANFINQRGQIREQKERDLLVQWLAGIGREALMLARDKFTLGIWAKMTSSEGTDEFMGSVGTNNGALRWVSSEDLSDGVDFKIDVDVTSVSAIAQEDEKKKFFEFLAGMNQFPQIAFSPAMVRELAYRIGYRNEKIIKEAQKMALTMEIGRQLQLEKAMGGTTPGGGNAGQQIQAQQTPPTGDMANNQLVPQNGSGVVQ